MKINWTRSVPVGIDPSPELLWCGGGLGFGILVSFRFLVRLSEEYRMLFQAVGQNRHLIPGAVMPDFAQLLPGCLWGFWISSLVALMLIMIHYQYHYRGAKSIYVMKRLPNRWELHRRCLTLPIWTILAAALLAALLTLLYFAVYHWVTPAVCLNPGQWDALMALFR